MLSGHRIQHLWKRRPVPPHRSKPRSRSASRVEDSGSIECRQLPVLDVRKAERETRKDVLAPGRKSPRNRRIVRMMYGAVAVIQTTFPDDLTPLNKEKYNMTKTQKQQPTSSGLSCHMSPNPGDWLICRTRRLSQQVDAVCHVLVQSGTH